MYIQNRLEGEIGAYSITIGHRAPEREHESEKGLQRESSIILESNNAFSLQIAR